MAQEPITLSGTGPHSQLSLQARGMLEWLRDRVKAAGGAEGQPFYCSLELLIQQLPVGREAIARVARELETAGYITRERIKRGHRFVNGAVWTLHEPPAPIVGS